MIWDQQINWKVKVWIPSQCFLGWKVRKQLVDAIIDVLTLKLFYWAVTSHAVTMALWIVFTLQNGIIPCKNNVLEMASSRLLRHCQKTWIYYRWEVAPTIWVRNDFTRSDWLSDFCRCGAPAGLLGHMKVPPLNKKQARCSPAEQPRGATKTALSDAVGASRTVTFLLFGNRRWWTFRL